MRRREELLVARDSHVNEDEELTSLHRLRGLILGDFHCATAHCLRRRVTGLLFRPAAAYPLKSRSQSPPLRTARPSGGSPPLRRRPQAKPKAHFQPWSARERVTSPPLRGRSPKSPSPKSSPSTSRSPSNGQLANRSGWRRGQLSSSPRAASPYNPQTDHDVRLELPAGSWSRFECRVGVADEVASRWPTQCRARFQLIDEDDRALLWESGALEPWAPMELCSVALAEHRPRHLCLRVQSRWPPEGALWIEPQLAARRQGCRGGRWEEVLGGELFLEVVARLACRDVARLLTAFRMGAGTQQAAWHCAFWHGFRQAYLRYFGPLRKQSVGIQWLGGTQGLRRLAPRPKVRLGPATCCQSCRGQTLPSSTAEAFDWRQICRRFHLAQLPLASVNFQLFNGSTPTGFVKDSGETLHVPRLGPNPHFRCGWNIPLTPAHFQYHPSSVVPQRSLAGPEPLPIPSVSEKDSAVVLPMALPGQLKLQWTLEVDPGRYLVVVTVGDRQVGFSAHLELWGSPIFSGEWVEAGSFRTRCLVCDTRFGAISLNQSVGRDDASPREKGTRLVAIRAAALALAREVEKERKAALAELSGKILEARQRLEVVRQDGSGLGEVHRAVAKLQELQAQKALKLFALMATSRRVTHPYVYLTGEATASPLEDVCRHGSH